MHFELLNCCEPRICGSFSENSQSLLTGKEGEKGSAASTSLFVFFQSKKHQR